MPRDGRTYITLHDGMPEHPKVEALSDAAFRVLVDLWCWCSRNLTDGEVPTAVWTKRAPKRIQRELLTAPGSHKPCVEATDDGVRMHDFLEHQRSAAQIDELKQKRSEAGKQGGKAKASATANARAKRKQPRSKDVAETEEVPNGTSQTDSSEPEGSGAGAPPIHAGTIVAAWVEAMNGNDVKPTTGMRNQVGKLANEMLRGGNDPKRLLEAAAQAGAKGYATLDREYAAMNGRALSNRPADDSTPSYWRGVR